jgi:3-oxoadipate enol-lactonase
MQTKRCEIIRINHIHINYCSYGNPQNEAVLFIHGYPLDQSMWEVQALFLADEYFVITYDIRGSGGTESGNETYSLPLFAADVKELLQTLKITKAVLCGFSMGGYIALKACINYPELFSGLILHDTQCNADTDAVKEQRMQSIDFIRKNGVQPYAGPFIKKMITKNSMNNSVLTDYLDQAINRNSPEQLSAILRMLAEREETCTALDRITIPVLIIRGAEDQIIDASKIDLMQDAIGNSKSVIIYNAGHLSNMEQPHQFNAAVKNFLQSI